MNLKDISSIIIIVVIGSVVTVYFSTDKPTAALTTFTLLTTVVALMQSADASEKNSEHTERSLKVAEIILEKTETERKRNDIRERLDLFFYPLNDYLVRGPTLTRCWQPDIFDKIGSYRYLANKEIIKQFEEFRKENYSHGRDSCNNLTKSIKEEVESLEDEYKKLNEELDALNKKYRELKESNK